MKTALLSNNLEPLERRNTSIQRNPKAPLIRETGVTVAPTVTIQGSQYLVDFGPVKNPRYHTVTKNKECSCGASYCEAIEAVRQYLLAGGTRAPDLPVEPTCPVCGSKTYPDRNWDGKYTRTAGWRCQKGGLRHFLETRTERIKQQFAENPWLIPPAPGYPGVRRDELMTWAECEAIRRKVILETGYDPSA